MPFKVLNYNKEKLKKRHKLPLYLKNCYKTKNKIPLAYNGILLQYYILLPTFFVVLRFGMNAFLMGNKCKIFMPTIIDL